MKSYRPYLLILSLLLTSLACSLLPVWNIPIKVEEPTLESYETETPTFELGIPEATTSKSRELNHGELRFLTDEATVSEAGYKPVHGCWPSSYYDDGGGYLNLVNDKLDGFCAWTSPSDVNPQVTWNTEGSLNGSYELSNGTVVFIFETQADYPLMSTIHLSFTGTGKFTTESHAEGTATFTSTCRSIGEENHCGNAPGANGGARATWDITGTVPWTMDFTP